MPPSINNTTIQTPPVNQLELRQAIFERIALNDPLCEILAALCLQVERTVPSSICSVMLVNEQTGALTVGAVPTGGQNARTILEGLVPGEFAGACGTAAHTKKLVIIEDTETDPRWEPIREIARPLGIQSCWSSPILSEDQRALGTFAISHLQRRRPTPEHLEIIESASYLARIAIQRRKDEDERLHSEARFRDLYESAPLAYFTTYMDGRIKSANVSAVELLGFSLDELKERSVIDLYAPTKDGREKAQQLQLQTQEGKEIEAEELEMQRADGTHIWVSLTLRIIQDGNGTPIERRAIVKNITARKKSDERLLLTKFVMDHAGDAILMAGPDKRILYANDAATRSLGYGPEQLLGKPIADISPTHEPKEFTKKLEYLGQDQSLQYESRHRTNQGKEFPVELTLSSLEHQGDQYTCAIVRDITDRKRGEELLATQKTILEMISTKKPLRDILSSICLMVEHHAEHIYCSIHLLKGNVLRNGAAPSLPETYTRKLDGVAIGPCAGSCGTAAYRKELVIVSDIATNPLWERGRHLALRHGLEACWSTPILSSTGSVLGTFAMYDEEPRTPNSESFKLIESATSLAGIALEQQRAETALQTSEERYRDLYESAPLAYFTTHMDGRIKSANASAVELLGYSLDELMDRPVVDLYTSTKDGREKAQHIQLQNQEGKEIEAEELEMQRADGSPIWVSLTVRLIRNSHGTLIERRKIVKNITKRKRTEQLQKLQQLALELVVTGAPLSDILNTLCIQVELMLPNSTCSILTLDPPTQCLKFQAGPSVPPAFAAALDGMIPGPCAGSCGTATFRGEPVYVTDTSTDPLWESFQDAAKQFNIGACWSYPIFSDGKQVLGSFAISSPQPHSPTIVDIQLLETVSFLAGIAIQRREKEKALTESELRYRNLYEDNPSMYFTVSLEGTVLSVNQFGASQLGYTVQELLETPVSMLFLEEDRAAVNQKLQECLENPKELAHWEFRKIRKDGRVIWVRETVRIVKGQSNQSVFLIVCEDITQHKQAEEKIQEINIALSNAMPGIAQVNTKGIYLEVNDSYADMLAADSHELIGASWEPTVHSGDLPSAHAAYQVMLQTGKGEFEAKAIRKDGSTFFKHVLMVKKVDKNGELVGHHCFMRDITERKVGEEALRESEGRLQDILDNSSAVMYVKNLQGHYLLVNREFERIFNLDRNKVIGKTDFDLFPFKVAKAFTENDQKVLEHGDALESEEVAPQKDGLHTYISNKFPLRNAQGTIYAICGISTDITQRKQAEMNIRLRNHILGSSPNGILITDPQKPDNPITYCNAAFEKMTGYSQEEILGRNCRFLQGEDVDQDGLTKIRDALSNNQECQTVLRNYKKDGTPFWNDLRLAPVFHEDGKLRHYIGVLTDITQRKSMDDSLRALAEASPTLTGENFFPFIVKTLATCLNVKYAFMTECTDPSKSHLRTLAFWSDPTFAENFEYPVAGTPCEGVTKGDICYYRHGVQQQFPLDHDLETLGVESYLGYPLFSQSGEILGHLVAMGTKPLPENSPAEAIIKLFATRAAAELERNNTESQLREAYGQTRELSARLKAAEESERKRIARELHDEFGQSLTGLKFDMAWLLRRLSESSAKTNLVPVVDKLHSMTHLTDDLIHTVRRIATSLRPSILDDLGLLPALEWHVQDFQKRTGMACTFSTNLDGQSSQLDSDQETALFRIAQELFTNILRHAEASQVSMSLSQEGDGLTLSVIDNGRGLQHGTQTIPAESSLGLVGITERATSLGGTFVIEGKSGSGTQATVHIPWTESPVETPAS